MTDPVRATRQRVERWATLAKRVGYLLFAAALVVFVVGFVTDFRPWVATVVVTCLVVGSILLAPAIVAGYGVRAAEREDRENQR